MKILEIHIYGFGQWSSLAIKNLADFQVFYGENEAGKSTIMAFIHGILFGFPTKQSSELRYEPKDNPKYGGKLILIHHNAGRVVIERVKGKASGDVTVALEDGTIGGEELLLQLLSNIDKGLFQAIFSFNIHGLQNIHQMKGDELGKFLFSTGTLGTERLAKTETQLQKELEYHFKPGGKKPLINEKLKAIHELNGGLKKAALKNQQYETLISDKESLQREIKKTNDSFQELQDKVEKLNEWKKINTLVKEGKWIKKELQVLGEFPFPTKGMDRLERLNQFIHPYNGQISSLVERINQMKSELETLQPDERFLEMESAIQADLDKVPHYEQLKLEKQQTDAKLMDLAEKISSIKERLHLPISEEEVLSINTNIYMKNQVEQVSQKSRKLIDVKQELEGKFHEEKRGLEELEAKIQAAENKLLADQERVRIEKLVSEVSEKRNELHALRDKIEFYRQTYEQGKKTDAKLLEQKAIQFLTIGLLLIILSVYSFFTKQWFLLGCGVFFSTLIGIVWNKGQHGKTESKFNQALNQLYEKEKVLIEILEAGKQINIPELQARINQDNFNREQLQLLKVKLEHQEIQYDKVIAAFEQWEMEAAENKTKLKKLSSELKIPDGLANSFFYEAFELVEQLKVAGREKKQLIDRMEKIIFDQDKITDRFSYYANQFLDGSCDDLLTTVYLLRNKLKEEHEKRIKKQEKQAKLEDLLADVSQISQEQEQLKLERVKLLNEAKVETEEQFYELGNKAEKKIKLLDRLKDIQKQLQYAILKEDEWESYLQIHDVDDYMSQNIEEMKALSAHLRKLQEKHASIKYEIQILEEGGVYSELLHQFKQQKYELDESAKEWAVYCLAQSILSRTIEKYKHVHLPRMLAKAEEYLIFLTEGNYHRIHMQKSGTGFLIERRDHTLFEANELSQATTEQIYVAIRLALATTLYEKYRFPIIIDDSFVNFDARRTQRVMELLKTIKNNQILFFTCHTHLLQYFQEENVLKLQKSTVEVIS